MHFTYASPPDGNNLHQGDVIRRTTALDAVLRDVHPHYARPEYKFFVVLTQTCDLIRRDSFACSSRYITIAAARPFRLALERYIGDLPNDEIARHFGFIEESRRSKVEQFVQRLLNNNEPEYFYLHRSTDEGLPEDVCVFLRLSIALKAPLHYEALLSGKVLQLTEAFEHKLGYLVGSVYGRVGTEDWAPDTLTESEFQKESRDRVAAVDSVSWLQRDVHRQVLKKLKALPVDGLTIEAYRNAVRDSASLATNKVDKMLSLIRGQLEGLVEGDLIDKSLARLQNKPEFRSMIK